MPEVAKTREELLLELAALRAQLGGRPVETVGERPQSEETRLRQIIDLVPHMIFAKDRDGKFLLANRAVADAYGTTVEALLGREHREIHGSAEEVTRMLADDLSVIESRRPKSIDEEEFTDSQGELRILQTTRIPYTESSSEAPAVLGVAVDVTRRRRLERVLVGESRVLQLLAQGRELRDVLTALLRLVEEEYAGTLGSILMLDDEGKHLHHAAAPTLDEAYTSAIDGAAIGPAVGSCGTAAYFGTPVIVDDIATNPLWADYRDLALSHGLRACWSHPILSSGGKVLGTFAMYYREKLRPSEDERALIVAAARLAGVAIEFRDAQRALEEESTQHRRTADLLRLREAEYRLTFENAPLGLTTADEDGRFLRVNQALCDMLGYSEQELLNMTFRDLTHPEDLERSLTLHEEMKTRPPHEKLSMRKRYIRKDGGVVDATVHVVQIQSGADRPLRMIAQVVDHTERIRAEQEARTHQERLAHVARVSTLGEMAASIAHEVNQPLTAITVYAQACARMIRDGMLEDAEILATMHKIGEEAMRAGEIIHRMRALAHRRESGRARCDINRLIRQVVKLAEVDARLNGVPIRLELARGLPHVYADGVQLQQVVLNLVRNGVEASDGGAEGGGEGILVKTSLDENGEIEVAVVDFGVGICDDAEEQVFESFFTTKDTGMGLGLSIGRSIITSHGGRLWFTRNDGAGATFRFTLPTHAGVDHERV